MGARDQARGYRLIVHRNGKRACVSDAELLSIVNRADEQKSIN